jgi:hypothetical protein
VRKRKDKKGEKKYYTVTGKERGNKGNILIVINYQKALFPFTGSMHS